MAVMRISAVQYSSYPFMARKKEPIEEKLKKLPDSAYPSSALREKILADYKTKNVLDIHRDHYQGLFDCKTLDEAKSRYPEFQNAIDAKDVDIKTLHPTNTLRKVLEGKNEAIKAQDLTLELLKRYYGNVYLLTDKDNYFNFNVAALASILEKLNIKMDNRYYEILLAQRRTESSKAMWERPEYRLHQEESWTPEREKTASDCAKLLWQQQDYRLHQEESWLDGTRKQKISDATKAQWEDDNYRMMMLDVLAQARNNPKTQALRLEAIKKPEYKEKMASIAKSLWKQAEYRIKQEESRTPERRNQQSEISKNNWADEDFRELQARYWTHEKRQEQSERSKANWKDPDYRKKQAETWTPERRAYHGEILQYALRGTDEALAMTQIVTEASRIAWQMHPEITEGYSEIAKGFKGLGSIIEKKATGQNLTQSEEWYFKRYHKMCSDEFPDAMTTVGQTQRQILAEWGFYGAKMDEYIELLEKLGFNSL